MWWLPCKETLTLPVNTFTSVHQQVILCQNTIKKVTDKQWCSALYIDPLPEKHRSLKRRREMKPPTTSVWSDKTWQSTFCLDVSGEKESACGEREVLQKTFEGLPAWHTPFFSLKKLFFVPGTFFDLKIVLFHYLKHCSRYLFLSDGNISGTHWFQGCSRARMQTRQTHTRREVVAPT